jgi:alpha-tubulin suppressor-like RCC1 family protein
MRPSFRLPILLAYVVVAAAACGESPFEVPGGVLTVARDSVVLTSLGEQADLRAILHDAAGESVNARVTWRSFNEDVATVDATGRVTAVRAGNAIVRATAAGVTDSVVVIVELKVASIEILGTPATAKPGDTVRLQLRMRDALGNEVNDTSLFWRSLEDFAPVDSMGVVLVRTAGVIRIVARAGAVADTIELTSRVRHVAVSAGGRHTCSLSTAGDPYCWGDNNGGLLGYGTSTDFDKGPLLAHTNASHQSFDAHARFVQITAGTTQSCGIAPDQRAYCWGLGFNTGTGLSARHVTPLNAELRFESISSGRNHVCAVMADKAISCWGQAIKGAQGSTGSYVQFPQLVNTALRFTAVASGGDHTCGITTDQRAYCWGANHLGQLGTGTADDMVHAVPLPVASENRFVAISAGGAHTCAIDVAGKLYCWGSNTFWQITSTAAVQQCMPQSVLSACATAPRLIPLAGPVTAVSAGQTHTCALAATAAYCWGDNAFGKAGGTLPTNGLPTAIAGAWTAISAGGDHSCGIRAQILVCWGTNSLAQIGLGQPGGAFTEPQPILFQSQP